MVKPVFIYALNCPVTGQPRYIGKTTCPKRRFRDHLSRRDNTHRGCWIQSLLLKGKKPVLEILDEVPETEWQQWEAAYIEFFREQGLDLTNLTLGGEDPPSCVGKIQSPEHIEKRVAQRRGKKLTREACDKLRTALTGRKLSQEHRERIRAATTGNKNPFFGKTHSLEVRAKISNTSIGRKHTPEARAKMSAFHSSNPNAGTFKTGQISWNKGIKNGK